MAGRHTIEVATFGRYGKSALTLPYPTSARAGKEAIARKLGVKESSLPVFSLFEGPLERPTKVLQPDDLVSQGAQNLSLRKWCFDIQREAKLVRHDDIAIHLLFSEASFRLDQGTLHPTESEQLELESLSDPLFPTERQFLELVRTIKGYPSFTAEGCKLAGDLVSNEVTIASGKTLTCTADITGLSVQVEGEEARMEWPWQQVRRWQSPDRGCRTASFEVCLKQMNAPLMKWMAIETGQAHPLLSAAVTICDFLKDKQVAGSTPLRQSNPRLAGVVYDPLAEFVNSGLFGGVKFSSIAASKH